MENKIKKEKTAREEEREKQVGHQDRLAVGGREGVKLGR